jgi:hypothetical protein
MGFGDEAAERLARACGRSVTILARRIRAAHAASPKWNGDRELIPALLAGGWSTRSEEDQRAVHALTDKQDYAAYETGLLRYLRVKEDSPLDREGDAWMVRAPVDAFVHLAHLIAKNDLRKFESVVRQVFGEDDPALELPSDERFYAVSKGRGSNTLSGLETD